MQLIRPTSEFKVGHLPFQGKVKGILPRWGRSKPSGSTRITFINCNVLSPDFQGRRPVLTLLWKRKCAVYQLAMMVGARMTRKFVYGADELHFFSF